MSRQGSVAIREIDTLDGLDGIETAWRRLHDAAPGATVFTAFDWVRPWFDNYGSKHRGTLAVLAAEDGSGLAGVAPLFTWQGTFGGAPVRRVDFLGHNFGLGDLVLAEGRRDVAAAFAEHLWGKRASWDIAVLKGLARTSPATLEILSSLSSRKAAFTLEPLPVQSIELEGTFEAYVARKGKNLKQQIARADKRVAALGGVRITTERAAPPAEVDPLMDRVVRIGLRSWKGKTDQAIGSNAHVERFYRQVAKRFNALGRFELDTLFAGDTPIAYVYGLVHGRDYFHIETAYDEAYQESSAGTYLNLRVIKRLFEGEYRRYVNEGDDEYKSRWMTDALDLATLHVFSGSLRSRVSRFAKYEARPALEYLRARKLS